MMLRFLFTKRIFSKGQRQTLVRYIRGLLYLFNVHTLILAGLGCLAVYACDKWKISWNMDFSLVATGTTFPLVFTIQQSFTRREKALSLIANLKASAVGLYYMHRDWCQDEGFPASMGNDHNTAALQCKLLLVDLLRDVRTYLISESQYESYAEQRLAAKRHECANLLMADMSLSGASQLSFAVALERADKEDPATAALRRCYRCFSRLSVLNERLGLRAGYTKGGEGGMSRTNQYLRYMMSGLEELRYIKLYRTPIMMRAAHGVLLHLFAIVLAPYFVHYCDSWTALGYRRDSCPAGYAASIVYCLITMLLFNTQQDLENPFDMQGMDDVFFDLAHEMDDVMQPLTSMAATPSGCSSPRHFAAAQDMCANIVYCPGSPNPRAHADLWPAPWAQQKMAAPAGVAISRRGSILGTVTEEESLIRAAAQGETTAAGPAQAAVSLHLAGAGGVTGTSACSCAAATGNSVGSSLPTPHHSTHSKQSSELGAAAMHMQPLSCQQPTPPGSKGGSPISGVSRPEAAAAPLMLGAAHQQNLHRRHQSSRPPEAASLHQQRYSTDASSPQGMEPAGSDGHGGGDGGEGGQAIARSDSDTSLGDDCSTQLMRVGIYRSDDYVD